MEAAETIAKKVAPRKPVALKEASYDRAVYQVAVDAGATFEDTIRPEFWAHVGMLLKPCDRIELIAEDFAWFGEVIVLEADRTWAKVGVLRFVELAGRSPDLEKPSPDYEVKYMGPNKKHCVIRLADKQVVQEGIALKADAERWVAEHVKAMAR
jgi:hypothetical protein